MSQLNLGILLARVFHCILRVAGFQANHDVRRRSYGAPDLGRGGKTYHIPIRPNKLSIDGVVRCMGGGTLSLAAQRAPIPPDPPGSSRWSCASIHPRDRGRRTAEAIILNVFFSCPQGR